MERTVRARAAVRQITTSAIIEEDATARHAARAHPARYGSDDP
jgi:hypothetical protein